MKTLEGTTIGATKVDGAASFDAGVPGAGLVPVTGSVSSWVRPLRWVDTAVSGSGSGDEFGLPIGTVTFLLTDVEGSTLAWGAAPLLMGPAVARHYEILDGVVAAHGGVRPQEQGEGDSIVAAFSRASDALRAAVAAQVALAAEVWPGGLAPLRVRMAVHAGEAQLRNEANYVGQTIIRTARLRAIAHGGQIVVSQAARDLTIDQLGDEIVLVDLGVHRLKDLARPEHVWQVVVPGVEGQFPPLKSLDAVPNNLPMALSTFVGRQAEIEAVVALSRGNRLVTVTGSGGAGKTRLAQQVAAQLAEQFVDGAWWVDLAPLDAGSVVRVTAGVVSVKEPEVLADRLVGRSLLLVFDNCEHVLDVVAPLVDEVLRKCPGVRVLATSRGSLDVPGEVTWRVPPLGLPVASEHLPVERLAQFDAVRLFLDRARRARPNFVLTSENGAAVAEVCSRLDGLPLAIELAAARAKSLTPAQILVGLENSLRLLTGGSRLVLARQQTLEASIAWSHDLLSESERVLLRRVSVFADGWDLEAAEQVCADDGVVLDAMGVLDGLERLIDQSLVRVDDDGGRARYRVLETVRQFGAARLAVAGESDDLARRHAGYFLGFAAVWAPRCESADEERAVEVLAPEISNINAALRFLQGHGTVEELVDVVVSTVALWGACGRALDGIAWCTTAIDLIGDRSPARTAALLQARVQIRNRIGQPVLSYLDATRCVALVESEHLTLPVGRARAAAARTELMMDVDYEKSLASLRAAFEELERAGDLYGLANEKNVASAMVNMRKGPLAAKPFFDDARTAAELLGNTRQRCGQIMWEAGSMFYTSDHAAAIRAFELVERMRPRSPEYDGLRLAFAVHFADEVGIVAPSFEQLDKFRLDSQRAGQDWDVTMVEGFMVTSLYRQGEYARARAFADEHRSPMPFGLLKFLSAALASCALGDYDDAGARLGELGATGADGTHNALVYRLQIVCLIGLHRGELVEAEVAARESLESSVAHGRGRDIIIGFQLLAVLAAAHGSWSETARLAGVAAVEGQRRVLSRRNEPFSSLFDNAVATARSAVGDAVFDAGFAEGFGLSLDDAVEFVGRARGERGRPTIGWAALTPTERRVADLVRAGKSNAEVAAELLMGVETVKTHLSRIFAKLGISNRTKLAALAPPPPV